MLMPRSANAVAAVALAFLHAEAWWPLLTAGSRFDAGEVTRALAARLTLREQEQLAANVLQRWPRTDRAELRRVLPGLEAQ